MKRRWPIWFNIVGTFLLLVGSLGFFLLGINAEDPLEGIRLLIAAFFCFFAIHVFKEDK